MVFIGARYRRDGCRGPRFIPEFLDRIPVGRFAEPEEMARPNLWMCSDDASHLSGHLMIVDGATTSGVPEPGEMDTPLPGAVR